MSGKYSSQNSKFTIRDFAIQWPVSLAETRALLLSANLTVHPAVERIILHGSRGLAGGSRADSDIDLSLLVNITNDQKFQTLNGLLEDVTHTTLDCWRGAVEVDLAVIFAIHPCKLVCFEVSEWTNKICPCVRG